MSRILFAWEIGQNYGHVLGFLPVAQALQARGHEVVFALRDLARAARLLEPHGLRFVQAPVWLPAAAGLPAAQSYADILLHHGFLTADALAGLTGAWDTLLDALRPDLLVLDSAPAAQVASAAARVPRALIGTGFTLPPPADPLPGFRWWEPATGAALAVTSGRALQSVNAWRARRGLPAWDATARLFEADETFLCAYPELDHYDGRIGARYWGPLMSVGEGDPPAWPDGPGRRRVFVYVYPEDARFEPLLDALVALPTATVVHAPGLTAAQERRLERASLRFSARPVRMDRVRAEADLVVCHGGFGTVSAALLAGRPLLLLPQHGEQLSLALRLQQRGVALVVQPAQKAANFRRLVRALLEQPRHRDAAAALAAAHPDWSPEAVALAIADRCEALLGGGRPSPA